MSITDSTNRDYHLHLVSLCIFSRVFNSMSLESRIMYDLHLVCININSYDKELDALSNEELEEKLRSLKAPWWKSMYSEVSKDHKLLEILYRRGCKLDDLKILYEAQRNKDTKRICYMYKHPSWHFVLSSILQSLDRMFSLPSLKSLLLITLVLSFFTCLIICIFESIRLQ